MDAHACGAHTNCLLPHFLSAVSRYISSLKHCSKEVLLKTSRVSLHLHLVTHTFRIITGMGSSRSRAVHFHTGTTEQLCCVRTFLFYFSSFLCILYFTNLWGSDCWFICRRISCWSDVNDNFLLIWWRLSGRKVVQKLVCRIGDRTWQTALSLVLALNLEEDVPPLVAWSN